MQRIGLQQLSILLVVFALTLALKLLEEKVVVEEKILLKLEDKISLK